MLRETENIKDGDSWHHLFFSISILFFCFPIGVKTQDWNSARISILSPQQVNFVVNTMNEVQNGIVIPDGTVLGITVSNSAAGSALAGFEVTFSSYLGQPTFTGDAGSSMPLDVLELTATNFAGFGGGTSFLGPLSLDAVPQIIVTSTETTTNWATHQIGISYELGTDPLNGLEQFESGFYTIEIDFILEPTF